MSETVNFRALLGKKPSEVEKPKPLAVGHYIGRILSTEFGQSRNKGTAYMRVKLRAEEETSDIEPGANGNSDISTKEIYRDYWITPNALYQLSEMLDAVLGAADVPFDQRIPDLRDARVMFEVKHRADENSDRVYVDIGLIVAA